VSAVEVKVSAVEVKKPSGTSQQVKKKKSRSQVEVILEVK